MEIQTQRGMLHLEILEEMRQQIRDASLQNGRDIPLSFDVADLTKLPQLNASQVYWKETQAAAAAFRWARI